MECSVCGETLTQYERASGGVCSRMACKAEEVLERRRAARAEQDRRDEAAAQAFAATAAAHDTAARVPFFDREVGPADPDHVAAFRARLRDSIREAVREPEPVSERTPDAPAPPQLDAACIACKGHCCRLGTGHAFLDAFHLRPILRQRADERPSAVYRDYVRRIPARAHRRSCVYQGEQGCVLPREMRADVCNWYECAGRRRLREALDRDPGAGVVVVAMAEGRIRAAAVSNANTPYEALPVTGAHTKSGAK